jgi:flagellar biosynthesis protein FliR
VILPGIAALQDQLLLWMVAGIRPGAAFLAAPVFGQAAVPPQLRLVVALAVGMPALLGGGVVLPEQGIVSLAGLMMIISEVVLGLALGFAVQIGFAASLLAGEAISNAMGLGFAAMVNPLSGQMSPAVGQFLSALATFLFLVSGGHLALAGIIADSYHAMPMGQSWLTFRAVEGLARFGGLIFSAGLSVALPVGFAMVMVQLVLGIIARATPTLNLFAVGMPSALLAGVVLLAMALPAMAEGLVSALMAGLDHAALIAKG